MLAGRRLVMVLMLMPLAGCGSTISHATPGGSLYERDDFRFVAPTGWQIQPSTANYYGGTGQIRLYVANQPLRPDCDAQAVCQSPLVDGLRPGGWFVIWTANGCVANSCQLPAAPLISIGNRQGVHVPLASVCEGTGSTEDSTYYAAVTPQRVDILFICARDPSDATRSAFLGFLDAIQWRVP